MGFAPISEPQWQQFLQPLFSQIEQSGPGKPHAPWRLIVNSILYCLHSKKWQTIPPFPEYASKSTAHRWYIKWKGTNFWIDVIQKIQKISSE